MTTCLLDMDGVIVNFVQGVLDAHCVSTPQEEVYASHPGVWDVAGILGLTDQAFWEPLGEEFWAGLGWMPDGEQILSAVERRFQRENVVLWTSPSLNYGCHAGKLRWVERHLPQHYRHNIVFSGRKELGAHPDHLLVDDSDSNVDRFAARGGRICQVPRVWNRLHGHRHRSLDYLVESLWLLDI